MRAGATIALIDHVVGGCPGQQPDSDCWRACEPLPRRTAAQANVTVAHILHRDIETRSRADLKKVGADKYAADNRQKFCAWRMPSTTVPCICGAQATPCRRNSIEAAADPSWLVCCAQRRFRKRH